MLPGLLLDELNTRHGLHVEHAQPVRGGSINSVFAIDTARGKFCLKLHAKAEPAMFACEARGLALLSATQTIRVPAVVAVSDRVPEGCPVYILMEWIEPPVHTSLNMKTLGEQLAKLHYGTQTSDELFGLDFDNFVGSTPQINTRSTSWVDFFRDHRLDYQQNLASRQGLLPPGRQKRLDKLRERIPAILSTRKDFPPSLLHGDLWSGNVISDSNGRPILIDPAVYYGDREAEIAFTELFGGFSSIFYQAYQANYPMDPNYKERRDLYNLYHLLNHLNLFGEMYGSEVDNILTHYVG